jgi:hypothetical protein
MAQANAGSPGQGGVPTSLEARPRAEALNVAQLMADVLSGRVRIPEFQRELQWQAEDARSLIDSVYRGYPVGTMIFWKRPAEAGLLKLGSVTVVAPERHDALWVVDGQQRIASLARMLLAPDPFQDAFATHFDLDHDRFVRRRKSKGDTDKHFVPLTEVLDSVRLQMWVSANGLDEQRMKAAFRLGSRIREYLVPSYVVETSDEAALREMFGRLNSTGKSLTDAEVFNALHGVRGAESVRDLRDLSSMLAVLEFGQLEEPLIYKSMLAILGRDVVGSGVPRLAAPDAARAFEQTAAALSKAIAFLKRDVGILHEALLPYRQPIVVLAKFFHLHGEPKPRTRELLARWLWRGAWSAQHAGDVVSTRRVLDLISPDEDTTVQSLLHEVGKSKPPFFLEPFNFRNAHAKLEVLALLALRPRHLETGEEIDLGSFGGADWLLRIADDHGPDSKTIAGRIVHPPLSHVADSLRRNADAAVFASHGIDSVAALAFARGELTQFVAHRSSTLGGHIARFLAGRAKFEANDRPSLQSMTVSDEES